MYPTIYHALYDLLGVEWAWTRLLNSFGFFVAIAFIVGSMALSRELQRKEKEGLIKPGKKTVREGGPPDWADVAMNGLLGFLFGWKILYLLMNSSRLFQPGSLPQEHIFSGEGYPLLGLLVGAGFAWWRWREYQKLRKDVIVEREIPVHAADHTGTLTFYAAMFGIAGAKLFHLLENPDEFREFFRQPDLQSFLSGLTVYGGLILGAAGTLWAGRRRGIPMLHLADAAAPGLLLAYGIGRIGCQVSGDGDWGIVNSSPKPGWLGWLPDWAWAYDYPNNVNGIGVRMVEGAFEGYGTHLVPPVYPTPLYETTMAVVLFLALWFLRKRMKYAGMMISLYLIVNGIERFLIEQIRVNNKFDFLGMQVTQAEVLSVSFFIAGLAGLWWVTRKRVAA